MNLYRISQDVNNVYNTYDSAVVAACTEEEARGIHPDGRTKRLEVGIHIHEWEWLSDWTLPVDVQVRFLGIAAEGIEKGVICASFNAE